MVEDVTFIAPTYECNPITEDLGRFGSTRTDDCEPSLFCIPAEGRTLDDGSAAAGLCAELEDYIGDPRAYEGCADDSSCDELEKCVTREFRQRYKRVRWAGAEGVCVPYQTDHRRVEVTMRIDADKLQYIRTDSRASIASNGVLGDQLINISVGTETLDRGRRAHPIADLADGGPDRLQGSDRWDHRQGRHQLGRHLGLVHLAQQREHQARPAGHPGQRQRDFAAGQRRRRPDWRAVQRPRVQGRVRPHAQERPPLGRPARRDADHGQRPGGSSPAQRVQGRRQRQRRARGPRRSQQQVGYRSSPARSAVARTRPER